MTLILLMLAAFLPLNGGAQSRIGNLEQRTLAEHNRQRAMLHLQSLTWDPGLARDARSWAEHLAGVGYLEHSESDPDDPSPQGENLWAGTAGAYSLGSMIDAWSVEKRNYRNGVFPDVSRTGQLEDVGHYTQMIWGSTRTVGCALARGGGDEYFVCRYAEVGNVYGQKVY
ncbi:CAP domain-containing protein [Sphingomonas arantia]|uniref:CAP domain-containing protein n=1 Tax=Sphingomonas arantia TaxID=1460676 RepID=A0ABW4U1K6_9SPHN